MAVVDHALLTVLLAMVLPVAVNASAGIISRTGLAPSVLRNVHSATVFTIVLSRMQSLMEATELLVFFFMFVLFKF